MAKKGSQGNAVSRVEMDEELLARLRALLTLVGYHWEDRGIPDFWREDARLILTDIENYLAD